MKAKTILYVLCAVSLWVGVQADAEEPKGVFAPDAKLEIIGDDFVFTEGPATDASGNLYFTDVPTNRIYIYSTEGKLSLFRENTGAANGLYFDKDGNLLACEGGNKRVVSISPDGKATVLAKEYAGKAFNRPNDLWIDPKGGVYFTDPAYRRRLKTQDGEHVYYIAPDRSKVLRVADDLVRPNGIIGSSDGKKLYVADPKARKIWKYDINADGTLSNKILFAPVGSDGMTFDERGNLYVTDKALVVFDPDGKMIERVETPDMPTNVTFGGKDNRTLFITGRGHLYSMRMNVRGAGRK